MSDAPLPLPRVLLLGDSISFGYAPEVTRLLQGIATVHRPTGTTDATINGALRLDTRAALDNLPTWLGNDTWDIIHFNFGLHDVKIMTNGAHQIPLGLYERNLEEIVRRLKETGAQLFFATTTPIPAGDLKPRRLPGDEDIYNAVALQIMGRRGVRINDLNTLAKANLTLQQPANVHFTEPGYILLATQVADKIRPFLPL